MVLAQWRTMANLELVTAADEYALKRWAAHGYQTDLVALGDEGSWTQLNVRDLTDVAQAALPAGFRFRTARPGRARRPPSWPM